MQLRLRHYDLTHRYIPLRRFSPRGSRRGMAERFIKAQLLREGWEVWRGNGMNLLRGLETFPNVKRKYERLKKRLGIERQGSWELLGLYAAVHHGMPDFICYRRGVLKFVECKLGHEQLNDYQKLCLPKLQALGFTVEVHKIVDACTKTRRATINLKNGEKTIRDRQLRLTKKLCTR